MKKIFLILALFGIGSCSSPEPTPVMVLPTIHGAHERNKNYTYEDLFKVIRKYDPEVIGVEIKPVDMKTNSDSLDIFYPLEMIMVRDSFPGIVTGIDDYNKESRTTRVNREMFRENEIGRIRELQKRRAEDPVLISSYEQAGIPEIPRGADANSMELFSPIVHEWRI